MRKRYGVVYLGLLVSEDVDLFTYKAAMQYARDYSDREGIDLAKVRIVEL